MEQYKTCFEFLIYKNDYTPSSIANVWGIYKQAMSKWNTENRPVPEEYICKFERLFKVPREYWLDETRRCLPYTDENVDRIFQYELKKKWTYEGESFSDIKKELEQKQQKKEELDDLDEIMKRIKEAKNPIVQRMYDEEREKEEQYYYFNKLKNKYSEEVCSYLTKNNQNYQSKEDYINAVFNREKFLSRVYRVMQNTDDDILEIIVSALEMFQESHALKKGITLSKEVSQRICDVLIEEENILIKQNEEDMKELEELFGEEFCE